MATRQDEPSFFVSRQAERRRPITSQVVALLTSVCVRCVRELALMLIFVAVHALGEWDFEASIFTLRNMAFCAGHRRVLLLQGIGAGGMRFHIKCRRFEAFHCVAGRTLDPRGTLGKLPIVNVFVTVGTFLEE